MDGDRFLLVIELSHPRRAGHPSVPDLCDAIKIALKELYDAQFPKERAAVNIRAYSLDFTHETPRELV